MKAIFAAETARHRHREWHWCRHWNGFLDNPLFRVVAARLGLPLFQVQAFVCRLEELANTAEPRGFVGHFRADLIAVSLGMSVEDAARIFAELEHPDIGWIDQEHLATFYDRNRDREDMSAAARKARQRLRERVRRKLAELSRLGAIAPAERTDIERSLMGLPDDDLERLHRGLADDLAGLAGMEPKLSTGRGVSRCDTVTVTPEKNTDLKAVIVDNFGPGGSGTAAGPPEDDAEPAEASSTDQELWLTTVGARIVVERMNVPTNRALNLIERWRRDLGPDEAGVLSDIIARASGCSNAAHFLVTVTEALKRHAVTSTLGITLPLAPVAIGPPTPVPREPTTTEARPVDDLERRRRYG